MNKKIYLLYFFPLFFSALVNANAQGQYANEVDLKASYCLGASMLFAESTDNSDPILAEFINLNNANYYRLQKFSTARVKSMNSNAINEMSVALTAGQEAKKRSTSINDACLKETFPNKGIAIDAATTKKLKDCRIRKQGESEVRRLEQCLHLDFLPY
jgi:hypothetical protein